MKIIFTPNAAALVSILVLSAYMSAPSFYDNYRAGKPLRAFPYKADVGWAEIDIDKTDCKIEAAQRVPQNIVVQASVTDLYQTKKVITDGSCCSVSDFCLIALGDTHDLVGFAGEVFPYLRYGFPDIFGTLEHPVRKVSMLQNREDRLDRIQFRTAGRQPEQRDVRRDFEILRPVPAGPVQDGCISRMAKPGH